MPLFGGFKKTFRLKSIIKPSKDNGNIGEPICGAYRINKEEFISNSDPIKRNTSPIVQMTYTPPILKHSHSSENVLSSRQPANTRHSIPDIAHPEPVPRKSKNEGELKKIQKQEAEKKKLELAEQKKREKLALKEQQIQKINKIPDKVQNKEVKEPTKVLRKEVKDPENVPKREVKKSTKVKSRKNAAPQPQLVNIGATASTTSTQAHSQETRYSTNTLESSISRTSGPPPYSEEPNITPNRGDNTGNTSFTAPPEDLGSWDLISQHRQYLNRPKATSSGARQTHMDLHYNMDRNINSEV